MVKEKEENFDKFTLKFISLIKLPPNLSSVYLKVLLKNQKINSVEVFPSHRFPILKNQTILLMN